MGIALASDALDGEGRILDLYSAYHDDLVPGLSWSAVLEAESFVLVVEDPDAPGDKPFLHWLLWNIPGKATAIPAGLSRVAHPPELPGAVQGNNSGGGFGWHGAQPPPGHGAHHYHFQLFALSKPLDLPPSTQLEELITVLKGLTIASGDLVGTYERLDPAKDAPSPGRTGGYGDAPYADSQREKTSGRGGLDDDDLDRHAPHDPDGVTRR
jgi:Raf kinase inhibitor-like YbhB/YbcL family protein